MYGKEQEIASIKAQLDLLLDKKNQLSLSAITAYDEEKKFALKQQISELDLQVDALRERLQDLEQAAPAPVGSAADGKKAKIQALIADGELGEALDELSDELKGNEQSGLILLKSRLNRLRQDERNGVISFENAGIERAKITAAALDLCKHVQ
jgi:uncharacterized coiled-coil protein SlyX